MPQNRKTYLIWSMSVWAVDTPAGRSAGRLLQWQHQSLLCAWAGTTQRSSTTCLETHTNTHTRSITHLKKQIGFWNTPIAFPSVSLVAAWHNWVEVQELFLSNHCCHLHCTWGVEEELNSGDRLSHTQDSKLGVHTVCQQQYNGDDGSPQQQPSCEPQQQDEDQTNSQG